MRSPGLLDLQVNGFAGIDFNSDRISPDEMDHALDAMLATGVTSCLPTLITAPEDVLQARFAALDHAVARSRLGPVMVPGYHLEGPFLNPLEGYAGCHPPDAMVAPDAAMIDRLAGSLSRPILLVTLAPERPGGMDLVSTLHAAGRIVAIGHSCADAATVAEAARRGATLSTHLGNGLPQSLKKVDNTLFAQLAEDGLSASLIVDGIHLPPHAVKVLIRAKGLERTILVSDAVSAAATEPGLYPFAGMQVEHGIDGSVRVPGGTSLAGSALTLDTALRNLASWGIATVEDGVRMASHNPRRLLRPALQAMSAACAEGEVEWSPGPTVREVRVGDVKRSVRRPAA